MTNWRDSNAWSDFGGRRLYKEEPPECVAAREAYEETGGILYDKDTLLSMVKAEGTRWYDHTIREDRVYRTYVVRIPYCEDVVERFRKLHEYLVDRGLNTRRILEKRQIKWFSIEQVREALFNLNETTWMYSRAPKMRTRFKHATVSQWDVLTKEIWFPLNSYVVPNLRLKAPTWQASDECTDVPVQE